MALPMPIPPKPPWYSTPTAIVSLPTAVPNCTSPIESPADSPTTENRKNKSYYINNDRPDDDNNDDVDCFPRQDKQPVIPQDISPNDTPLSLIESNTDTRLDTTDTNNDSSDNDNNHSDDNDDNDDDDDSTIIHDNYDDYSNADYNYDAYLDADNDDDDDDDSYTYCSSDEDDYYNNTPKVIFDMHGNQFTLDDNKLVPYDDKPMTLQAAQRQINAILAGCTTASSIKEFTDRARQEYDEFFLPKNKNAADRTLQATLAPVPIHATNDDHDAYLYHRWNDKKRKKNTRTPKPIAATRITATPTYHTASASASASIKIPVKDEPSITSTLRTLCTLDTRSSDPSNNDTDAILNITIWNQPIVQYRIQFRPNTHNRSRHPSTAVQYALIGVYDKLLNLRKLPCLLSFFTSIICVVLSRFILLADSFTMVKIDDRYPDEWND